MAAQGYNARLHESLGERHKGPHKQSLKDRSHESEAMEKKDKGHKYGAVKSMAEHKKLHDHHLKEAKKHAHALAKKK